MGVAEWLRTLNLGEYEAAFRDNSVTADLLPSLTAEDLKDLGITSVGHRRRLLDAIDALRADGADSAIPARQVTAAAEENVFATAAERRQLSVMFCDVIDYTALSSRLDPEDLSTVIRSYQTLVASTIERLGGFIADYLGDGVLIYFGWPEAHEANAERAVRAALAIVDAIADAPAQTESIRVRIGIATGLVVIGEPLGVGEARQQTAIGETPNRAARLQALAPPNGIVIDATTHRQIGGLFDCQDLGLVTLKGFPDRVAIWQVLAEADVESRFEALHAGTMAPLIGREEELDLLLHRWRQAASGHGQLVLLSGEPGIGKSRLIAALEERLNGEAHATFRYFSSPHHQDSALYPIVSRWEHDLQFSRNDPPQEKLHKLETELSRRGTSPEEVALIADLLSVPVDDRYPSANFSPQRKKEKTFEALVGSLIKRARAQPILMLYEDAHWTDASSLELLDKVVGLLADVPILMVVSFRPEFHPPWGGLSFVSQIMLRRLTQAQAVQLAERVVVERALPTGLLARIVSQTDGVPLFIEELTKSVLEDAEQWGGRTASLEVPATLQASLVARLDRLPAAKQIAQIGAVIGRDFAHPLLAAVARMPEAHLANGIDALVASGLAFRSGTAPDANYTFKHALVRDAAYSTLLRSQRHDLHGRIAGALETQFTDIAETQPELLAHHFTQAGMNERAIAFWRLAGLRSVAKSAHSEARAHFTAALDLLENITPGERRDAQELDFRLNLAVPLIALHGFGSLQVEACALRAMELSGSRQGSQSGFAAQRLAWNSCLMRQPVAKTLALARDLSRLAEAGNNPAEIAVADRALGYSLLIAGALADADFYLSRGAALADTITEGEFAVYGEHPSMVCRIYGGQAKLLAGFPTTGARLLEEAVAFARHAENAHALAWALGVSAHVFRLSRETEATTRFATASIELSHAHNWPQWLALGERSLGWAMHQQGAPDAGMTMQRQGVQRWMDTGARLHTTDCELQLAGSFLRDGQMAEARHHLDAARAHCVDYNEGYLAAEIDRTEALLLQAVGATPAIVDDWLQKSLQIAWRQGARLLELRTTTTFARLLAERGERERAVNVLAPVYGWFTEGFETTDLTDAKALLDELA